MFVMTIDQRRSRRDVDRVDTVLEALATYETFRPFERTAGDEVQGVVAAPEIVIDVAVALIEDGHWSVGIGVGPVEVPLPAVTRAGRGVAFEAARAAVTRAKSAAGGVAIEGSNPIVDDVETVLALLAYVVSRRTDEGRAAVGLMRLGSTQAAVADRLGISKQAVSQRLSVAGWGVETKARDLAARLLGEADS
ncbi:MAG: hypothetical protein LLG14_17820 [Nocardiaceae bacterium]|nr:hypothetical protein [Nocardiaceae bacterium]